MSDLAKAIIALKEDGLRNRQIARELDCHESTVSKCLSKNGKPPQILVSGRSDYFKSQALKRSITRTQLINLLIQTIDNEKMVASVLDDGVE